MGRSLANKVTLVVGAGSPGGIGRACAERLAQEGATVVLTGTRLSSVEANAAEIVQSGGQALGLEADLADEGSVARVFETVAARYGRLDFMHLNAADTQIRNLDTDALTVPLEVFDRSIEVNLKGQLLCIRHALPLMLKSGGGGIVATTSESHRWGLPHFVAYNVSKAGLDALLRHVANRWGKQNIRANAIGPGMVLSETLMGVHDEKSQADYAQRTPSPRLGTPNDIAAMVAFLASDDAAWINGQIYSVNGGLRMG